MSEERIILEPGIYSDISNEDYHSKVDGISNSWLQKFKYCPANAMLQQNSEADHFVFGRAFHALVLEGPVVFNNEFAVTPDPPCPAERNPKGWRSTNEYKAVVESFKAKNVGKSFITLEDYKHLKGMDDAVKSHPLSNEVLKEGIPEQTVIWIDEDTGLRCKCRPDWIPSGDNNTLADLKSAKSAAYYPFKRSMREYGYDRQAAFYLDGYNAATGSDFDAFVFPAVEKKPPYLTGCYPVGEESMTKGRAEYKKLLGQVKECMETGYWPPYVLDWRDPEQSEL